MIGGEPRVVRVFISSTFLDMQEEREELVKRVFPQLRKMCEDRGVTWGEVDLRWGIPDEQKAEGKVLPICLAEIERCRPYFIGLLGERYGWVPDEIPDDLIDEQKWLAEHREHSVTALEIMHGVLNNPAMAGRSFFYFRDPRYLERLPAGSDPADFAAENEAAREKVAVLKDRIRDSIPGERVHEDYPDPQALGQLVLEDLTKIIEELYPKDETPDPLDREAAEHEAFAQSRARVYIGRQEYFDRLDEHAAGDGPPLVVLGESGSGKSALLANWALHHRAQHPDELVLLHFIGATPYSADWAAMVRRIMGELKRRFDLPDDIPDKPDELQLAFANWLHMAAAKGRVILILDALNQLEDREGAPDLVWLPPAIPGKVRLLLSTLPGRPLDDLKKRGWPTLEVQPLTVAERTMLIGQYLAQYTKALSVPLADRIASSDQAANPLFLTALLEELRLFGAYERLTERVEHYLAAPTIPDLYERILARWEGDYERGRPGLVGDAMSCLWAARRGLSEAELLDILGTGSTPLPRAHWSPLYLAAEQALVSRSGLVTFSHDYLREAVRTRFLPAEGKHRAAHLRLAEYFSRRRAREALLFTHSPGGRVIEPRGQALLSRSMDELPWQLREAGEWDRLLMCITDVAMFEALFDRNRYELLDCCLRLPAECRWHEVLADAAQEWAQFALEARTAEVLNKVGAFLHLAGQARLAIPLQRKVLAVWQEAEGPSHPNTASGLDDLALLLQATGDYQGAEPLYRQALMVRERALGPAHPDTATSLNNLGMLLYAKGDYQEAEPLHRRALAIWEESLGGEHPSIAGGLNNLAMLLEVNGDYEEAESLYRRALAIQEKALGPVNPAASNTLNNLADLLRAKGDLQGAEQLHRRALAMCEKALGPEHPDTAASLTFLGVLYQARGDYAEAESLYRRAWAILVRVLGSEHPQTTATLNNLASLLCTTGNYAEAEALHRQVLEARERVLGPTHPDTAASLTNLAELLRTEGDYEAAEPLQRRALAISERALGPLHPNTAAILSNLGLLCEAKGDYEGAEELHRQALGIRERTMGPTHPDTATSLNNLAELLRTRGDYESAEQLHRQALAVSEEALGPMHPNTAQSLNNLALVYKAKGDYAEAETLFRRALAIWERELGPEHLQTSLGLNNLASLLYAKGEYVAAQPLCRRAVIGLHRASQRAGREHPHLNLVANNYAAMLMAVGCSQEQAVARVREELGLLHED